MDTKETIKEDWLGRPIREGDVVILGGDFREGFRMLVVARLCPRTIRLQEMPGKKYKRVYAYPHEVIVLDKQIVHVD